MNSKSQDPKPGKPILLRLSTTERQALEQDAQREQRSLSAQARVLIERGRQASQAKAA